METATTKNEGPELPRLYRLGLLWASAPDLVSRSRVEVETENVRKPFSVMIGGRLSCWGIGGDNCP